MCNRNDNTNPKYFFFQRFAIKKATFSIVCKWKSVASLHIEWKSQYLNAYIRTWRNCRVLSKSAFAARIIFLTTYTTVFQLYHSIVGRDQCNIGRIVHWPSVESKVHFLLTWHRRQMSANQQANGRMLFIRFRAHRIQNRQRFDIMAYGRKNLVFFVLQFISLSKRHVPICLEWKRKGTKQ